MSAPRLPMDRFSREQRDLYPEPGTSPVEHLIHTLAVYLDEPDDRMVLTATTGIYGEGGHKTGLTFGDLRGLLQQLPGGAS